MFDLSQKLALVTGAGAGIGAAIATAFAARGARVIVTDLREDAAAEVAASIRARGHRAESRRLDVTDGGGCQMLAEELREDLQHLAVLVNNAGTGAVGTVLQTDPDLFDRVMDVNVRGVFNVTRALLPAMLEQRRGSIINIASVAGIVAVRERLAYTTSKFGVVGMTRALTLDHSHTGIRFNCICPGRVETDFVRSRIAEYPDPAEAYREMSATQLTGRMVTPEEVAAAAVYLASDESAMVTGSALMIDGGWSAGK